MPTTKMTKKLTAREPATTLYGTPAAIQKSNVAGVKAATIQWMSFSKSVVREDPTMRIHRVRTGARASHMIGAANTLGVPRETIFNLVGLPTSTANRKIANGEILDMPVTERLARLAAIKQHAEATFGDTEVSRQWLLASNTALGGCSPLSLLDTDIGAREVSKALASIAYGGVA